MAQNTNGMDGLEAVHPHQNNYPEVVQPEPTKEAYAYSPGHPQAQPYGVPAPPPEKKILGLRRTTFILSALLLAVVIAAAVGGGVGGSQAVQEAYDRGRREEAAESSGGEDSESDGRIKAPPTKGLLELDCPGMDDEVESINFDGTLYEFRTNCGVDRPAPKGGIDIMRLPAYSYVDCLTACASFNEMDSVGKTRCKAAHFNAKLANGAGGNCWLKRELGDKTVHDSEEDQRNMVTGDLE